MSLAITDSSRIQEKLIFGPFLAPKKQSVTNFETWIFASVRNMINGRTSKFGHMGSSTAANWVSFDLNVSCSSCWGYSLINTLKLKKKIKVLTCVSQQIRICTKSICICIHCSRWCCRSLFSTARPGRCINLIQAWIYCNKMMTTCRVLYLSSPPQALRFAVNFPLRWVIPSSFFLVIS